MTPTDMLHKIESAPTPHALATLASECVKQEWFALAWEAIEHMLPLDAERANKAADVWRELYDRWAS